MTADEQQREGNQYVLVFGLPCPDEPLTLAPGLSVLPIREALSVFDLAALGGSGFRQWAALEPVIHGCTCEIESAVDSAVEPGLDALNRAWLAVALLVLQGFTRAKGVAFSSYRWQDVPIPGTVRARTNLPPFRGGVLDLHFKMFQGIEQPHRIAPECTEWLGESFPKANSLVADSASFHLALQAATDWRFAPDARSAVARLWSGIEAVFGVSSELVFRISLLAASLLEPRGQSRLARFGIIKKLYGLRSKAVHGDELGDDKLREAMVSSFDLLRELILLMLSRGHILTQRDFDEAVFL